MFDQSDQLESLSQDTALLEELFALFQQEFSITNPPPKEPAQDLKRSLDWKFWAVLVTGIFNVALAATRTALAFFSVSYLQFAQLAAEYTNLQPLTTPAAIIESAIAVVAVEALLLVMGVMLAVTRRKKDRHATLSPVRLWASLGLATFISVVAGTTQSLHAMTNISVGFQNTMNFLLMLATGPVVSVAVIIAGETLGHVVADADQQLEMLRENYTVHRDEWETKLMNSWRSNKSKYLKKAKGIPVQSMQPAAPAAAPKVERPQYWLKKAQEIERDLNVKETVLAYCQYHEIVNFDVDPQLIYAEYPDMNQSSIRSYLSQLRSGNV